MACAAGRHHHRAPRENLGGDPRGLQPAVPVAVPEFAMPAVAPGEERAVGGRGGRVKAPCRQHHHSRPFERFPGVDAHGPVPRRLVTTSQPPMLAAAAGEHRATVLGDKHRVRVATRHGHDASKGARRDISGAHPDSRCSARAAG